MSNRPLVSFLLISYKQEKFIREAVRSALNQTYTPLEIVFSDDCSPDRTYEIIEEEASAYKGPHKLLLHRNEANVGLAGNINKGWELCHGDFIVIQAGDDISLPYRVETLTKVWREPTPVDCVFSDVMGIDAQGDLTSSSMIGPHADWMPGTLEEVIEKGVCTISGCSAGYSRSLMSVYGPLDEQLLSEDHVLPFRALLDQGIRYSDDVLLKYRLHSSNIFHGQNVLKNNTYKERKKWAKSYAAVAMDWLRSFDKSDRFSDDLRVKLVSIETRYKYHLMALDVPRYKLPVLAMRGIKDGLSVKNVVGIFKRNLFYRHSSD